ncbi:MAG TPA: long-chain-fatty-acid--CoA ligase [Candidatus Thioglobus sp.]|jgi:long-chain acyl-CoA synthetase|nr:long-chain-fatty-acid--CoA ligase [Candidatus Thioglobus sp.]HIL20817.1 long-chain-fatty-acid--CoA ligase [Candidatus Thioglobus sp.]
MSTAHHFLDNQPQSFAKTIDESTYSSIVDLIEQSFTKFADRPAFSSFGQVLTYAEIERKSGYFAAYLQSQLGLKKGDRVALMSPNIMAFPVVMLGILRAGLVQVNVNPLYTPRELTHQLNDADTDTIIIYGGVTDTLAEMIDQTSIKNVVIANLGDATNARLPSPEVNDRFKDTITLNDVLVEGANFRFTAPKITLSDLLFLQYTGGTTGLSKGAALSHGNLVSNIMMYDSIASGITEEGKEIVITALPLYHIFALMVNFFSYFKFGALNVLIANPRDMPGFVAELGKWKFSAISGVNTLYNGLLHTPGFADLDFDNLKAAWGGGAAIQRVVSDKWLELTGQHIKEGYGLSETSPILTLNPLGVRHFTDTVGLPMPSTEITLRDPAGNEVADGEPGELWARGPQVMKGYWRNPEANAEVMTEDDFFKTGDVAILTKEGYYKIVDRIKDMVLVSGFNVYPTEIENIIAEISGVVEVAVIGVPNEKTGESVKAFVVKSRDGLSGSEVKIYCHDNLAAYKVPKFVEFIDELPKSTVGKILRRELRNY